jgi:hypothetical protein
MDTKYRMALAVYLDWTAEAKRLANWGDLSGPKWAHAHADRLLLRVIAFASA